MTTTAKRYRVIREDVTVPTNWQGGKPNAAAPAKIHLVFGDVLPKDLARRAREAKLSIDDLPEQAIRSLLLNDAIEEVM